MSSSADQSGSQSGRNQGRRKINIERIENGSNLQVTFSKRRAGLFKKASELCTLTGAELGIVVFSPSGKPHSFGHPNISTIMNRHGVPESTIVPNQVNVGQPELAQIRQQELDNLAQVEANITREKAQVQEFKNMKKAYEKEQLRPTEGLNYEQLHRLKRNVMEFSKRVESQTRTNVGPFISSQPFQDLGGSSRVGMNPDEEGPKVVGSYHHGPNGARDGDVEGSSARGDLNRHHSSGKGKGHY